MAWDLIFSLPPTTITIMEILVALIFFIASTMVDSVLPVDPFLIRRTYLSLIPFFLSISFRSCIFHSLIGRIRTYLPFFPLYICWNLKDPWSLWSFNLPFWFVHLSMTMSFALGKMEIHLMSCEEFITNFISQILTKYSEIVIWLSAKQ